MFPYLSHIKIEESLKNAEMQEKVYDETEPRTKRLYYLISKDLKSIESFPWYYPYSRQWNAYCPFEEIKEIEIQDLNEIKEISIIQR